jgi:hypothetical protein
MDSLSCSGLNPRLGWVRARSAWMRPGPEACVFEKEARGCRRKIGGSHGQGLNERLIRKGTAVLGQRETGADEREGTVGRG